jgi:hypothetical protein
MEHNHSRADERRHGRTGDHGEGVKDGGSAKGVEPRPFVKQVPHAGGRQ